jgi:hypothetical protein
MKITLSQLKQIIKEEMHYDAVTSASQAPREYQNVLKFIRRHSPGEDGQLRYMNRKWKIRVTDRWSQDGEAHSEMITIEPTIKAAKEWLNYDEVDYDED